MCSPWKTDVRYWNCRNEDCKKQITRHFLVTPSDWQSRTRTNEKAAQVPQLWTHCTKSSWRRNHPIHKKGNKNFKFFNAISTCESLLRITGSDERIDSRFSAKMEFSKEMATCRQVSRLYDSVFKGLFSWGGLSHTNSALKRR